MRTIEVRNAHEALPEALYQLRTCGVERPSRNGPVLMFPTPLTTLYRRPTERVVFWPQRDANPFFHFFEALWMLSGREDVEFPTRFNSRFATYSDDGVTFNGAYGFRWRAYFGADQLRSIASSLRERPDCRRQVLTMWDPRRDLGSGSKDVPCNTQAYFQRDAEGRLDMVVTNRSNDLVWGAYGSNAVHFSMLQEYVAALIGCPVGRYWQVSMNSHLYVDHHRELLEPLSVEAVHPPSMWTCNPYAAGNVDAHPMVSIPAGRWDRELAEFMANPASAGLCDDPFFSRVAAPMYRAYARFSDRENPHRVMDAQVELGACVASDWKRACVEWLERRRKQ